MRRKRERKPKDSDDVGDMSLLESIFSLEGTKSGVNIWFASHQLRVSLPGLASLSRDRDAQQERKNGEKGEM